VTELTSLPVQQAKPLFVQQANQVVHNNPLHKYPLQDSIQPKYQDQVEPTLMTVSPIKNQTMHDSVY
jgi:hypothetical protein